MKLSRRFDDALVFASRLHRQQVRKGTQVPYISHLLAVAAIVLEHGGDEDTAIAALPHDTVEDQGGPPTLRKIRSRFGPSVARFVAGCTDAAPLPGQPKPPWKKRKQDYIAHLPDACPEVRLISAADKLHNARAILADVRAGGDRAFDKFKASKTQVLWYYDALARVFNRVGPRILGSMLSEVIAQIKRGKASRGMHATSASAGRAVRRRAGATR